MTTYTIDPLRRIKLRTNGRRRFLLVSVYDGRARVEASTDSAERAVELIAQRRRDFPIPAGRGRYELLDQAGRGGD